MTDRLHPDLELQDLLDGQLDTGAEARVRAHLAACEECRAALEGLRRARDAVRALPRVEAPPTLLRDVTHQLRRSAGKREGRSHGRRRVLGYGLAAAAAILVVLYLDRREDMPSAAIRSALTSPDAAHASDFLTSDSGALERFFASHLPFHVRVYDFGMMQYRLVGGRIGAVGVHPAAIYTYAGPAEARLTCEMYQATVAELPQSAERREHNGITFFVYRRGRTTAVFWQEGEILCAAVSDISTEDVVTLAFAKAIKF
jgi:anti-sigma factor RsiW